MSKNKGNRKQPRTETPSYKVGYGKPPVEHQFPKGKCANPDGRPKKKRLVLGGTPVVPLEFGHPLTNFLALEEAYRPVTVREGDKITEIPAIQAVLRATIAAAAKGNRFAQRNVIELLQSVEDIDCRRRQETEKTLMDYKRSWTREIARERAAGRPEPQPVPHPDDIFFDDRTGSIVVCGPGSEEEKLRWDKQLQRRAEFQEEVNYCVLEWRKAGPARKTMWLRAWHDAQKGFDIINDNLPLRYRVELKDRSCAKGASRPGSERQVVWPGG